MSLDDAHFVMPPSTSDTLAGSPVTDFVGTDVPSDTVCMSKYNVAYFLWFHGVGTAGTHAITVLPIDEVGGTATTAIPYQYKRVSSTDTNTAWAWATSNTMTTTAGSDQIYVIKVHADDLPLGYEYVYSLATAVDSTTVLGGCIIIMDEPRYAQDTSETVIT